MQTPKKPKINWELLEMQLYVSAELQKQEDREWQQFNQLVVGSDLQNDVNFRIGLNQVLAKIP